MNIKIYNLLMKLIERNDIGSDVKDDMLRQYALDSYRIEKSTSPDEPMIKVPIPAPLKETQDDEIGTVERPSPEDLQKKRQPWIEENARAIEKDLDRFNADE